MSSREKLENQIRNNPLDVSLADLKKLMELSGFRVKETKEGCMFFHDLLRGQKQIPSVAKPHGKGKSESKVKKCYVHLCLKAIDDVIDIKRKEAE